MKNKLSIYFILPNLISKKWLVFSAVTVFIGIKEASAQVKKLPPASEIKIVKLSDVKPDDGFRDCWNMNAKPRFPGGEIAFINYLKAKLPEAKKDKFSFSFIIKRNGTPDEINIFQYSNTAAKAKLTELIARSPKWTPGVEKNLIYYPVMYIHLNN